MEEITITVDYENNIARTSKLKFEEEGKEGQLSMFTRIDLMEKTYLAMVNWLVDYAKDNAEPAHVAKNEGGIFSEVTFNKEDMNEKYHEKYRGNRTEEIKRK